MDFKGSRMIESTRSGRALRYARTKESLMTVNIGLRQLAQLVTARPNAYKRLSNVTADHRECGGSVL